MKPGRRTLLRIERRPWTLAAVAAAGLTLLLPSAVALYGPPELLDSAIRMGDAGLIAVAAGLFAVSTCVFRVLLRRRRLAEEAVDEEPGPSRPAPAHDVPHARADARAHLR